MSAQRVLTAADTVLSSLSIIPSYLVVLKTPYLSSVLLHTTKPS